MKSSTRHSTGWLRLAGLLGLLALPTSDILAQETASIETSIMSNGGDNREGGFGEMYSTIGEPVAADEVQAIDDKSTWTGFWQITPINTDTITGVREVLEPSAAESTGIGRVAPNPFASRLAIEIPLARPGTLRLTAYDMLGREAAVLAEGRREAGTLRIEWEPEGLEAGSYLLQLTVDGEHRASRLVRYFK